MSKYLTRQMVNETTDLPLVDLDLTEELGGFVKVRALNALERSEYQASIIRRSGEEVSVDIVHAEARLAALALCNENGSRMYPDADEGMKEIGLKSAKVVDKICNKVNELSALTPAEMKELLADLKGTATSGSASASQEN